MHLGAISTDTAGAQNSFGVGVFRAGIFKYQKQECRRGVCALVVDVAQLPPWGFHRCFLSVMVPDLGFVTTASFLRGP